MKKRSKALGAIRDTVVIRGCRGIEVGEEIKPYIGERRVLVCIPPRCKRLRKLADWKIEAVPRSDVTRVGRVGRVKRIPSVCREALKEYRK